MMNEPILAEFHCHSNYSPDSLVSLEEIIRTCRSRGVGKIAITDHGCMVGALKANQMAHNGQPTKANKLTVRRPTTASSNPNSNPPTKLPNKKRMIGQYQATLMK